MIDIKKKPNKIYIEIYNYKTKKKIVTLAFSKESLKFANHIHKYFKHIIKTSIESGWINRSDWTNAEIKLRFPGINKVEIILPSVIHNVNINIKPSKLSIQANKIFRRIFKNNINYVKDIKVIPKYKK
jgi:hypothetical protein